MSAVGRKIGSFFWWSYPRGSLEYDIMVGVILAFIFLTPAGWFHDQPRLPAPHPHAAVLAVAAVPNNAPRPRP